MFNNIYMIQYEDPNNGVILHGTSSTMPSKNQLQKIADDVEQIVWVTRGDKHLLRCAPSDYTLEDKAEVEWIGA